MAEMFDEKKGAGFWSWMKTVMPWTWSDGQKMASGHKVVNWNR